MYPRVKNGPIHKSIIENVSDLIDENYRGGKAIRIGLRKHKLTSGELLQDNSEDCVQESDGDNDSDDAEEDREIEGEYQ